MNPVAEDLEQIRQLYRSYMIDAARWSAINEITHNDLALAIRQVRKSVPSPTDTEGKE